MDDSNEENEYGGTPENTSNEEEEDLDRYTIKTDGMLYNC